MIRMPSVSKKPMVAQACSKIPTQGLEHINYSEIIIASAIFQDRRGFESRALHMRDPVHDDDEPVARAQVLSALPHSRKEEGARAEPAHEGRAEIDRIDVDPNLTG
jgi:hypothetical protein